MGSVNPVAELAPVGGPQWARRLGSALVRVLLLVVTLIGCRGGPPTSSTPTESMPAGKASRLDCAEPIAGLAQPPENYEAIGDVIAIPTSRSSARPLQADSPDLSDPSHRLFAKTGLLVRADRASELAVTSEFIGRAAMWWGNTGGDHPSERFLIGPCPAAVAWIAYPGGFWVSAPVCVDLVVRHDGAEARFSVAIGTKCPGQAETT